MAEIERGEGNILVSNNWGSEGWKPSHSTTLCGWKASSRFQEGVVRKTLKALRSTSWNGLRVCEIGVGFGFLGHALISEGATYVGIEPSRTLRERLRTEAPELTVVDASLPELSGLPLSFRNSFDYVFAENVVEHAASGSEALTWMRAATTLLVPGGSLVVMTPDIVSYGRHFWSCDYTHQVPFSVETLQDLLKDAGLTSVTVFRIRFGRSDPTWRFVLRIARALFPIGAVDGFGMRFLGWPVGTRLAIGFLLASLVGVGRR